MNKGFIKITDALYSQEWGKLCILMKDFRPTHIEFRHWENDIWYIYGVSEKFDHLNEWDAVPQYDISFTVQDNGEFTYEFFRVRR